MSLLVALKRKARPLARLGCVSIGTVYVLVGILAILALAGILTGAADEDRMVRVLGDLPGGTVLIWGIVAGLAGYTIWRIFEALTDPYEFGRDWRGMGQRIGVAASGLAYAFLAYSAARMVLAGTDSGDHDDSEEQQQLLVGQILEWPLGVWLVGGAGLVLFAMAAGQFYLLARGGHLMEVNQDALSRGMKRTIDVLAWAGYTARSVILGVLGWFLIRAAYTVDPGEVGDTDTAFDTVGGGAIGDTAFLLVAAGTIGYGVYMYLCAIYYRFEKQAR